MRKAPTSGYRAGVHFIRKIEAPISTESALNFQAKGGIRCAGIESEQERADSPTARSKQRPQKYEGLEWRAMQNVYVLIPNRKLGRIGWPQCGSSTSNRAPHKPWPRVKKSAGGDIEPRETTVTVPVLLSTRDLIEMACRGTCMRERRLTLDRSTGFRPPPVVRCSKLRRTVLDENCTPGETARKK